MSSFLQYIDQAFVYLTIEYGYLGIFIGAFLDVIIPIVPSEIILGLTGVGIAKGTLIFLPALLVALLGNLSAATLLWYLGKKYGHDFILKYGKYMSFDSNNLKQAENMFNKRGYFAVFFSQFVPLMRSLIPIPSGVLNLSYKKFIICIGLGATIWNTILITAGYYLGDNYGLIEVKVKEYGYPLLGLCVLFLFIGVAIFYHKKKRN